MVTELFGDVGLSNGLDWTDDRRLFYYSDTTIGRVDVFDTDPDTGALSGRRPFVTSLPEPDGLTLDAEGCVWLAVWGSGELRRYTPDGRLDTVVRLPARQVTSAAFGGPDLGTLYITTAREGLTPADLGRATPRGRHLRLHPRRHRPPAVPVRGVIPEYDRLLWTPALPSRRWPYSWTSTSRRARPRQPTCAGPGSWPRPSAIRGAAICRCTSPRPRSSCTRKPPGCCCAGTSASKPGYRSADTATLGRADPLAIALREAAEETGLADLTPWPDAQLRHLVIVGVPAGKGEPAHEHADLRYFMATRTPDAARAENEHAPLRWLSIAEAYQATSEVNLRETLDRLKRFAER